MPTLPLWLADLLAALLELAEGSKETCTILPISCCDETHETHLPSKQQLPDTHPSESRSTAMIKQWRTFAANVLAVVGADLVAGYVVPSGGLPAQEVKTEKAIPAAEPWIGKKVVTKYGAAAACSKPKADCRQDPARLYGPGTQGQSVAARVRKYDRLDRGDGGRSF